MPDTSPRGLNLPGEAESWDFGLAAGFYLDATQAPWAGHYRMAQYVTQELPAAGGSHLPRANGPARRVRALDGRARRAGDGAARSRALAFRVRLRAHQQPGGGAVGAEAFTGYLGPDRAAWDTWDATALLRRGAYPGPILVDQGDADQFLPVQLDPAAFQQAAAAAGQDLTLRMQPGYDHSYWFVQTFMADHMAHHARALLG